MRFFTLKFGLKPKNIKLSNDLVFCSHPLPVFKQKFI